MTILTPKGIKLTPDIETKLKACLEKAQQIIDAAAAKSVTVPPATVRFTYTSSAPRDILTPEERAQSLSFIIRYEHLPVIDSISLEQRKNQFYLTSIHELRYALTEYRPILMNERDSTYYNKVNATLRQKLFNKDESKDMRIIVHDEKDSDISERFAQILKERMKGIDEVLKLSDFDYLFNGILQHSDHKFTQRFWEEYYDGRLNYIYISHAAILEYIKEALRWHYVVLNYLTFPKMGPL